MYLNIHLSMPVDPRVPKALSFAATNGAIHKALIDRSRVVARPAGEWLYGEGDEETGLVAVLEGALHLYAQAPGGEEALISLLPKGGLMGQSAVFGGGPRLITAVCAVPSEILILPDAALRQTAHDYPELWSRLSYLIYGQLSAMVQGLAEFTGLSSQDRLTSRLYAWSTQDPRVPVSQSDLAEMIGASRIAVNRWLGALETRGLIQRGYRSVRVLDRDGLGRHLDASVGGGV